jgi:glycosyltransferase involved in cell wall biosynthesis
MVGEAPKKLHQYYQQKNLAPGIIDFKGFIPYEDLGNVVQSADAFVLFSKRENMPCVVLEALCCGLPVITSRAGGVAEVIDKPNGIVVHDYNTAALATAMMQLYKNYESYHPEAIAAKARSMFGYEIIGARIAAVYRQVAGSC